MAHQTQMQMPWRIIRQAIGHIASRSWNNKDKACHSGPLKDVQISLLGSLHYHKLPFPFYPHNSTFNPTRKAFWIHGTNRYNIFLKFSNMTNFNKVLTTPLCILIYTKPIPIDLQGALLPIKTLPPNFLSCVTNQCLCGHI